ncbi:MAG: hypothetical protein AAFQ66_11595 [Pseudomonadota bacterium]
MVTAYWLALHFVLGRTIVLDVETGSLEIELEAELSGKAFRDLWICSRRDGDQAETENRPAIPVGCPTRTHFFSDGAIPIATPVIPLGSNLKITSSPNLVRIDVEHVPEQYRGTDAGRLEGGALILTGDALDAFGTLPLNGKVTLGALFSETDRLSTITGRYQIRGWTPWGLLDWDMRVLREGDLLAGARTRFVSGQGDTATGQIVVTLPDPATPLMRVTAISDHSLSNLGIQYYFTDEVIVRPSPIEALILDPFVQLALTFFGAIAGYGWLKNLSNGNEPPG